MRQTQGGGPEATAVYVWGDAKVAVVVEVCPLPEAWLPDVSMLLLC